MEIILNDLSEEEKELLRLYNSTEKNLINILAARYEQKQQTSEAAAVILFLQAKKEKSSEHMVFFAERLIELDSKNSDILILIGKIFTGHTLHSQESLARKALELVLLHNPESHEALSLLSNVYSHSDMLKELELRVKLLKMNIENEFNSERIMKIAEETDRIEYIIQLLSFDSGQDITRPLIESLQGLKKARVKGALQTNRLPSATDLDATLRETIKKFILSNEMYDKAKKIGKADKILTGGSCFARNLGYFLNESGYHTHRFPLAEELNSTFANRLMLEWLLDKPTASKNTQILEQLFLNANLSKSVIKSQFENADHFIFTLGTTQCFFDKNDQFRISAPGTNGFKSTLKTCVPQLTDVSANEEEINKQIEMLRILSPNATICFTLSPVPLNASFVGYDAITGDCISKSTLRIAIQNVIQRHQNRNVTYFPSFEIVRWLAPMYEQAFGKDDGSMSHVNDNLIKDIVHSFIDNNT